MTDEKKMIKDEMKNRISMALKDPILQQGFEIICKENTELKDQIEEMKCCGNCAKYNSGYGETPCKLFASGICGEWR